MSGTTLFAPMKVLPEIRLDHTTKTVTGIVKVDGNVYLTVRVGDQTSDKGSLRKVKKNVHPFKKKHYIEMIENEARSLLSES